MAESSVNLNNAKQITEYTAECFASNFEWKLPNFQNLPNALLVSDKIQVPGTDFYW